MRVIGLAGWSGSGKTTLLTRLMPELTGRGLTVSTLKHAHHAFDIDVPGKDSWVHREAGASEVLIASARRVALIRELRGAPEPSLHELLALLAPVDLVVVEGFKREPHPKIAIHRLATGKRPLVDEIPNVRAVATDDLALAVAVPILHLDDIPAIADAAVAFALPVAELRGQTAAATPA